MIDIMSNRIVELEHFQRIPKVELHLHLEGAIPYGCMRELIRKYSGNKPIPNVEAIFAQYQFRGLAHFIKVWNWQNQFLREYEDFTFLAAEVAKDLAGQNVMYAEIFFSPGCHLSPVIESAKLAEAIRIGFQQVPEIEISLVADLVRDHGPDRSVPILNALSESREELDIVGVGIGGSEQAFPPAPFAPIFERAREAGFRTTAHAGESAGAESIWEAIRSLKVDRIGHATRAIEDIELVDYLAEHKIPLEICLISNLRTGVINSATEHPIREYLERDIPLCINTDDPKFFNNSLAQEYYLLHSELGFTLEEIKALVTQGVLSSWLPEPKKKSMAAKIQFAD